MSSAHPSKDAREREDERFMSRALELAAAQLGKTAPNPSVGCVVVKGGKIVGEGATGNGGRPHAEELALAAAGGAAKDACAYVTLEPCNQRSTGAASCAQRLIEAGIRRVVIACEDPHHLAAHGISRLGAAGVETLLGVMRAEAEHLNRGFFKLVATGRPWLAIDSDASTYDAEFDLERDESFEAALERLGKSVTSVFVRPGTPIAAQLKARGLVDEDRSASSRE
jgi:diaminohydroxyphosphoribosylaminopyrimidine deaminase / 5-amino-6-(5-phosphoribosylamino)uracil reductase